MIIGLGSDLCNIERIQSSLDRFGERFENRVFTETERAKARKRLRRGGDRARQNLTTTIAMESEPDNEVDLEALANALDELGRLDPELAVIVDLRFIAGLSLEETARVTGLSPATVKRRWSLARGWLRNTIESGEDDG